MTEMRQGPAVLRSRKAIAFAAAAAEGRFALQVCSGCDRATYPPREICPACWSMELAWKDLPAGGELVTDTILRASYSDYFRSRLPWRIGTVKLDAGPVVLTHVHGAVAANARVRMIARIDKSGQGVLMALPEKETEHMGDDRQLRELTRDPENRRVLVTDGNTALGRCMAEALAGAGASTVFVGMADGSTTGDDLAKIARLEIVPLDITDGTSVNKLARDIGEQTDIVINTAGQAKPGATMERGDLRAAREEMETNYFGLMRLIQAFGPGLRARGADGACSWVNLLSVYGLSNRAAHGPASASQAAAYSLSQELRGEFAGSGVKVINVFFAPDQNGHQPSLSAGQAQRLADAVVAALRQGIETVSSGPVAEDLVRRFREDPFVLERELAQERAGQHR